MNIKFDYSKLKGRIKEKLGTEKRFCEYMGMAQATLITKFSGVSYFTQKEVVKACGILEISLNRIPDYFFVIRVQKN